MLLQLAKFCFLICIFSAIRPRLDTARFSMLDSAKILIQFPSRVKTDSSGLNYNYRRHRLLRNGISIQPRPAPDTTAVSRDDKEIIS
jgi:hypothetical protein